MPAALIHDYNNNFESSDKREGRNVARTSTKDKRVYYSAACAQVVKTPIQRLWT